ncbi:retrovirus-related Pol polyprotein from transposon RE1 [Trichonephila clavipes]|nr:retrovirus-related Pol polyprotein from transposon RE1 [Trichonephila clavipes]
MNSVASTLNRVTYMEFNNQISVLTPNNWNTWKHDMQVLLMHYGCWQFIIQTEPEQPDEEATYKEKLDLQLREDVGIFISRVKTAATRLQEAGHKLDDLYIGFQLIRWLPQEFQSTVQQIYRWKEEDFRVVKIEAELILEANRLQLMKQDLEKAENAYLSSFTSKKSKTLPGATAAAHGDPNGKNDYQKKGDLKPITNMKMSLATEDKSCPLEGIGTLRFRVKYKESFHEITLSDVLFNPKLRRNLLSGSRLENKGAHFVGTQEKIIPNPRFDLSEQQEALMVEVTIPNCYKQAIRSRDASKWHDAMDKEINVMKERKVWDLVDHPDNIKILENRWVYTIKYDENNKIVRYKARLVARGNTQLRGESFDEVFSPVINFTIVRLFFTICVCLWKWTHIQVDITNAYLYANLDTVIYMKQPTGYETDNKKVYDMIIFGKEMENVNFVLQLLQKNFDLKIMGKTKKLLGIEFEELDSDFATNRDDRVSMGGFITFIDETPISWRTFKQKSVSLSTMEAEYVSLTEAAKEFIWLKNVIDNKSLNLELSENVMFCDNQAAISFSKSPVENYRTKHIDVRYHFLRNLIYDKPDGRGYELVSSVRALVPQKFSVEEELMHVKHVEVKSPHVGVMWKFGRGVISSGIVLVT